MDLIAVRPSSRKARLAVGLIRPLTFWDSDRTRHFKRCSWFLNLTRRADIKLNKRVLLRRPLELLTSVAVMRFWPTFISPA